MPGWPFFLHTMSFLRKKVEFEMEQNISSRLMTIRTNNHILTYLPHLEKIFKTTQIYITSVIIQYEKKCIQVFFIFRNLSTFLVKEPIVNYYTPSKVRKKNAFSPVGKNFYYWNLMPLTLLIFEILITQNGNIRIKILQIKRYYTKDNP